MIARLAAAALALGQAACSPVATETPANADTATAEAPAPAATPAETAQTADANTLTLAGLGGLRIGEPVPADSSWASPGAQVPGECRTISSPDYPGAHAIVVDGAVRRITIGERSGLTLAEGIGSGAGEQAVRAAFPGLLEEPHKYVEAPAKYLTSPDADRGNSALRFEIGRDGKVSLVHVGTMPVLAYVEGCA